MVIYRCRSAVLPTPPAGHPAPAAQIYGGIAVVIHADNLVETKRSYKAMAEQSCWSTFVRSSGSIFRPWDFCVGLHSLGSVDGARPAARGRRPALRARYMKDSGYNIK